MKFNKVPVSRLSVLLGLFVLSSCTPSVSDVLAPDLVLHNGKIVTVDEGFSIVQAVAIENGRFVAVGSDSEILALAGTQTEKVDLEGKTVLPGLNDSHVLAVSMVADRLNLNSERIIFTNTVIVPTIQVNLGLNRP